jgi:hypothetical protein
MPAPYATWDRRETAPRRVPLLLMLLRVMLLLLRSNTTHLMFVLKRTKNRRLELHIIRVCASYPVVVLVTALTAAATVRSSEGGGGHRLCAVHGAGCRPRLLAANATNETTRLAHRVRTARRRGRRCGTCRSRGEGATVGALLARHRKRCRGAHGHIEGGAGDISSCAGPLRADGTRRRVLTCRWASRTSDSGHCCQVAAVRDALLLPHEETGVSGRFFEDRRCRPWCSDRGRI